MKNIYFFLLILTLFGCDANSFLKTNSISTICPNVLFASEHKTYLGSFSDAITLDNVNFQAEINNAEFVKGCQIVDKVFSSDLSTLFIITPLNENLDMINLPFYIAVIDENKNIQDIQYYLMSGNFQKNLDTKELIDTELRKNIRIVIPNINKPVLIVIGFMLDQNRLKL
tara:strand:+ start:302 stop:811 length:510 start_codon:yes stop_codon:yes gene_type:complete